MKKFTVFALLTVAISLAFVSCGKDDNDNEPLEPKYCTAKSYLKLEGTALKYLKITVKYKDSEGNAWSDMFPKYEKQIEYNYGNDNYKKLPYNLTRTIVIAIEGKPEETTTLKIISKQYAFGIFNENRMYLNGTSKGEGEWDEEYKIVPDDFNSIINTISVRLAQTVWEIKADGEMIMPE